MRSSVLDVRSLWKKRHDRSERSEFGGLAGDASYVAIWQGSTTIADLVQVGLITHILGLDQYGQLALVIAFVTLIGEFFRVRVGYAATSFGSEMIVRDPWAAVGLFQITFLVDLATDVFGFLVIVAVAPMLGSGITGGNYELVIIGGLALIASSPDETFTAILRLLDRFKLIAIYSAVAELSRVVLVLLGLLLFHSLVAVLVALVLARLVRSTASMLIGASVLRRSVTNVRLARPAFSRLDRRTRREILGMMLHTNFVGYGRVVQVQVPTLLLGGLVGTTETAIYKLGMAGASFLGKLADPASSALMPRFSRMWADRRFSEIRQLIRQTSRLSVPTMFVAFVILVVLRIPFLELLGAGDSTSSAATVLVIGAAAQGLYGAVFWNRSLLFAAKKARHVSVIVCMQRRFRS